MALSQLRNCNLNSFKIRNWRVEGYTGKFAKNIGALEWLPFVLLPLRYFSSYTSLPSSPPTFLNKCIINNIISLNGDIKVCIKRLKKMLRFNWNLSLEWLIFYNIKFILIEKVNCFRLMKNYYLFCTKNIHKKIRISNNLYKRNLSLSWNDVLGYAKKKT